MEKHLLQLLEIISNRYRLNPSETLALSHYLNREVIDRARTLVRENKVSKKLYILYDGAAAGYYTHENGIQYCAWVTQDVQVIGDIVNIYQGNPVIEGLHVFKNSVVYSIDLKDLEKIKPKFHSIGNLYYLLLKEQRALLNFRVNCRDITLMIDRIRYFDEHMPNTIRNLPQQFMADFLGTERETFCRLLKGL